MRLVTFESASAAKLGAVIDGDETIVDLQAAQASGGEESPALGSMLALIEAGTAGLELAPGSDGGRAAGSAPARRNGHRARARLLPQGGYRLRRRARQLSPSAPCPPSC